LNRNRILLLEDSFVLITQKEDKKNSSVIQQLIDEFVYRIQNVGKKNRNVTP